MLRTPYKGGGGVHNFTYVVTLFHHDIIEQQVNSFQVIPHNAYVVQISLQQHVGCEYKGALDNSYVDGLSLTGVGCKLFIPRCL